MPSYQQPDPTGHFGIYGGSFVSETLTHAISELREAYARYQHDPEFLAEFHYELAHFVGRPSPIYHAARTSREQGGAQIYLKREDLNHTGAHKINNVIGQAMLAKRMGKPRVIAETGAGQHGVATATICARYGLECVVYMGSEDVKRQSPNVYRMNLLGATRGAGRIGQQDAQGRAQRGHARLGDQRRKHLLHHRHRGRAASLPDDGARLPERDRQRMPRRRCRELAGGQPDVVVACVGGGSNAMGIFYPYIPFENTRLIGVEAAGEGLDSGKHSASLQRGSPGVLHGNRTYILQDDDGQITETHSVSAGLDYPGVGPEHAWLKDIGRAEYVGITDKEALEAFHYLCRTEGIIPALESSHAIAYAMKLADDHEARPDDPGQPLRPRRQGHRHGGRPGRRGLLRPPVHARPAGQGRQVMSRIACQPSNRAARRRRPQGADPLRHRRLPVRRHHARADARHGRGRRRRDRAGRAVLRPHGRRAR